MVPSELTSTSSSDPQRFEALFGSRTQELLSTLENLLLLPLILCTREGQIAATSPDRREECALASREKAQLLRNPDGSLSCPFSDCPHHEGFATHSIDRAPEGLVAIHCGSRTNAVQAVDLIASKLRADSEKVALVGTLARAREEIHLLRSLAGALQADIDHRSAFLTMFESLRRLFPVEAAEIWVPDEEAGVCTCIFYDGGDAIHNKLGTVHFDPGLVSLLQNLDARVLHSRHEVADVLDLFFLRLTEGIGRPVVVLPLLTKAKLLGILLIRFPETLGIIDFQSLEFLRTTSQQISLVLQIHLLIQELLSNEGFRKEIEIARQIQNSFLPQSLPTSSRFDLFARCVTATRVGGDYYDFFQRSPQELGMLIADVSGHSVASGIVVMSFRGFFRLFLERENHLDDVFEKLNSVLSRELKPTSQFLSAVCGTFCERTGVFRYVNAGHNLPLILRRDGAFESLEGSGLLLGVVDGWKYEAHSVTLEPGDLLVLYTDGIVEAENNSGEFYGLDRFKAAILQGRHKPCQALYHAVLKDIHTFQDGEDNRDDITLVLLKYR